MATTTRCDLHLHSAASVGNDEWYTRLFGCPESYAAPAEQYRLCKARGMSLVTLTDHDTIAGGLELVDFPDFFLSEEITATFPENGCVVHVLAWDITPAQHDEIQARRRDVYSLCEYLRRERISHALAHPLLSPSWQLDADTLEKALLLFPALEAVNGLLDRRIEPDLSAILGGLTPEVVAALARKHGIAPVGPAPHRKALTAGSDDHVHRGCASVYVEVEGAELRPADFLARCLAGEARLVGRQAHLDTMALCVKHTTYHHLKHRHAQRAGFRDPFTELVDLVAGRHPGAARGAASGFAAALLDGVERASLEIGPGLDILQVAEQPSEEEDVRLVGGLARLCDRVMERALHALLDGAQDFDLYGVFEALRDLAGGLVSAAPVFFAADHFGKQEQQVRRVWSEWRAYPLPPRPGRLAVFTDARDLAVARARAVGHEVLVPCCGDPPPHEEGGPVRFQSIPALTTFTLPLVPPLRLQVPSLVSALEWVWREGITHVELATPGPMGLAGLLVARVLRLPVSARGQREALAFLAPLGADTRMGRAARRYVEWFYARADDGADAEARPRTRSGGGAPAAAAGSEGKTRVSGR